MQKSKKVLNNFKYGVIAQVVTLILGIVIPKLLIVSYGSEVNGLLSSIRQVFVYVALLEAGIGTASLQALYKPMAEDDHQRTSEIMAATDHYYKRTGILYGIAVVLLSVGYPVIVKSEIALPVVVAVIFLQGASGVINYFFQGKYAILLRVDGKGYITTNASTLVSVTAKIIQIVLIMTGFNVVAVQAAYFIINLLQMIYITWYVQKHYSWLNLKTKPDYDALSQSKNVIIHQISGLIFNNTDILVLTLFCSLKTVSVYSLYSLIISCVSNIIDTVCSSVEFVLGQAFNSDRDKFMKMQELYETYYLCFSFALFTVTLIMLPSFVAIYSKGITDANYVDRYLPFLFVTLNVLMYARRTSSQIINFSGHFKQTQWRSVLESIINLTVSLVMVSKIGIYGVLVGTIAALLYRTNDIIIYANWNILKRKPWATYRRWGQNMILLVFCVLIANSCLPLISGYVGWVITSGIVSVIVCMIFVVVDSLCDKDCFLVVSRVVKGRLNFHL
ncbi:MAG: sugar isomerase [Eubacterium sp.]|nr:sugar isomerase [Eubacterium sp.]